MIASHETFEILNIQHVQHEYRILKKGSETYMTWRKGKIRRDEPCFLCLFYTFYVQYIYLCVVSSLRRDTPNSGAKLCIFCQDPSIGLTFILHIASCALNMRIAFSSMIFTGFRSRTCLLICELHAANDGDISIREEMHAMIVVTFSNVYMYNLYPAIFFIHIPLSRSNASRADIITSSIGSQQPGTP